MNGLGLVQPWTTHLLSNGKSIKILSIRQPWAWLVVNGLKPIENRTWASDYRGELYIHAGKIYDKFADMDKIKEMINNDFEYGLFMDAPIAEEGILLGGIVGKVNMVDCVTESNSPWFHGPFGFVFLDPEVLQMEKMLGQLRIFNRKM